MRLVLTAKGKDELGREKRKRIEFQIGSEQIYSDWVEHILKEFIKEYDDVTVAGED